MVYRISVDLIVDAPNKVKALKAIEEAVGAAAEYVNYVIHDRMKLRRTNDDI